MPFKIATAKLDTKFVETLGLRLDLGKIYQLQIQLHMEKYQAKRLKNKYSNQIPIRPGFEAQKNTPVSHTFLIAIIFPICRNQFWVRLRNPKRQECTEMLLSVTLPYFSHLLDPNSISSAIPWERWCSVHVWFWQKKNSRNPAEFPIRTAQPQALNS